MEQFKIRLSYESWDSIFSNNDNMDINSLFNIFLNNYLRIVYTSFPLIKIIERSKSRQYTYIQYIHIKKEVSLPHPV
jgi:hypothetical protein